MSPYNHYLKEFMVESCLGQFVFGYNVMCVILKLRVCLVYSTIFAICGNWNVHTVDGGYKNTLGVAIFVLIAGMLLFPV